MFSIHYNTTVCLTSCVFVFRLKKITTDFELAVISDATYFVTYLVYEDFKDSVVFNA